MSVARDAVATLLGATKERAAKAELRQRVEDASNRSTTVGTMMRLIVPNFCVNL